LKGPLIPTCKVQIRTGIQSLLIPAAFHGTTSKSYLLEHHRLALLGKRWHWVVLERYSTKCLVVAVVDTQATKVVFQALLLLGRCCLSLRL
jgi:hypothetical protein